MAVQLVVHLLLHLTVATLCGLSVAQGNAREYCLGESLNASCPTGSVVVMGSAMYGRMNIGRCVEKNLGYLGCGVNALGTADKMCSGRPSCEIRVSNPEMDSVLPCLKELSRYLEASYYCQPVLTPNQGDCQSTNRIQVGKLGGYLSSHVAKQTGCGFEAKSWVLEAQPGQKLSISLLDFSWNMTDARDPTSNSKRYGYIIDLHNENMIQIEPVKSRERLVYTSLKETVQIVVDSNAVKSHHFLIKYEGVGCSHLSAPRGAWLKRDRDVINVGCHGGRQTWHLRCVDNQWRGVIGNCTHGAPKSDRSLSSHNGTVLSNEVFIILIVAVSVVLSATIIFIGFVCIKSGTYNKRRSDQGDQYYPRSDVSKATPMDQNKNDYMHIWDKQDTESEYNEPVQNLIQHSQRPLYDVVPQQLLQATENNTRMGGYSQRTVLMAVPPVKNSGRTCGSHNFESVT